MDDDDDDDDNLDNLKQMMMTKIQMKLIFRMMKKMKTKTK
jgi:hypothetical protein